MGALAALDVTSGVLTNVATDPIRVMSADLTWSLTDLGATADDGQEFGLAHSDYTAAEIEECLEASGSIDRGNKIALEQANRLVRTIGVMTESPGTGAGMGVNNGRPIKTKLNWLLNSGDSLVIWIRNGSQVVYTTGAIVTAQGNIWVKDSV